MTAPVEFLTCYTTPRHWTAVDIGSKTAAK